MRVLVTGATGVIGRRVVPLLISAGHDVTACGRSADRLASAREQGAAILPLNLLDENAVRRAVDGHDVVINLATHMPASTTRMMFPGAWRENDRLRRDGSAIVSRAAADAGVKRLIQESFGLIYTDNADRWIDETSPVQPVKYNRTTLDAERNALTFGERGGAAVVLRFAGFYGPDARFLEDMITMIRRGWSPLPGDPDAYFSSISHDDAARGVLAALTLPGGIYNVSDDEPLTRRVVVDTIASAVGVAAPKFPPRWTTMLMGSLGELMSRSERISNRKLRAKGWAPVFRNAREGLLAALAAPRSLQLAQVVG